MMRPGLCLLLLLAGCAPVSHPLSAPVPLPGPSPAAPAPDPAGPQGPTVTVAPVSTRERSTDPDLAYRSGLMPLQAAGVPAFAQSFPEYDGRGVLIAILDSGIDPSIPGLQITTTGLPKLLDLRDFSGEGRVALRTVERRGDTLLIGGRRLLGAARVAAVADGGVIWGGGLDELPLGEPPAADVDGNGTVGDTLPVVVVRGGSGWVMFADLNGNGSVADDRPIRDYLVARDTFGWSATNQPPPVTLAANLSDSAGAPLLDLFFDTSSHGSHVSGIASGHDIYGVKGFEGVAPGARLLGLKVANDAHGGVTVTNSMIRALRYAIQFARERQLPLVVNLSFGVGNEVEGVARIDARVDSLLAANPDVVMMVAAGNDGPGLSTVGFPGSSSRVLAIAATEPGAFDGFEPGQDPADPIADFSSRGGELGAPDLAVPGRAYSTVPNFATGGEDESGTSMATPYAAGLAARLISAAVATKRPYSAALIAQALRNSATLPMAATVVDAGAGTPDLARAWDWLARFDEIPTVDVAVGALRSRGAVFLTATAGEGGDEPVSVRVVVRQRDGAPVAFLRARSTAPWVGVPATIPLLNGRGDFTINVRPGGFTPGVHTAAVELSGPSTTAGILARVPVTFRLALSSSARVAKQSVRVAAGGVSRVIVPADSGRGMQIEIATELGDPQVTAALHEPGGMPFRDGSSLPAGAGDGAALFDISAGDVVSGMYEVDIASGRSAGSAATVTVRRAPVRIEAGRIGDSLRIAAKSLIGTSVSVRLRAGLVGAEQQIVLHRTGDAPVRIAVPVPTWATRVQVDSRMPREQWPRFTDFALAFQDRHGRQVASAPINYAFGRAAPELPARLVGDSLILLLTPAFAGQDIFAWDLDLRVRFYVERVLVLDQGGKPAQPLAPGRQIEQQFLTGPWPLRLPAGFAPVIVVLAQEDDDTIWTREIALQGGTIQ